MSILHRRFDKVAKWRTELQVNDRVYKSNAALITLFVVRFRRLAINYLIFAYGWDSNALYNLQPRWTRRPFIANQEGKKLPAIMEFLTFQPRITRLKKCFFTTQLTFVVSNIFLLFSSFTIPDSATSTWRRATKKTCSNPRRDFFTNINHLFSPSTRPYFVHSN